MPDFSVLLARLAAIDTTSLVDAKPGLRVLPPALRPVRRGLKLVGRAVTADAREDLMPMLAGLHAAGPGDVLVAAGSAERAVAGELFGSEAQRRGLAGIVIDGFCRDTRTLAELDLPIYARGTVPTACPARAVPVINVPLTIGSVVVQPGDLVIGDDDGLVVATVEELEERVEGAEAIQRRETHLQAAIASGTSLFDRVNYDEHLEAVRAGRDSKLAFS